MGDAHPSGSMELGQLQELISDNSPAKLESGVAVGLEILNDIKKTFAKAETVPEIAEWMKSSDKLRAQTAYQRSVVGVIGSTGAGKSSVINAVLDEECLVPTNCMRACTAVITEIAYNTSDRKDEKYRAEIHFITRENWIKELRVMLADMSTGQEPIKAESSAGESEASIAYHKIRSVYPFLRSDEIKKGNFSIDHLIEHPSVKDLLGTVKHVASSDSKKFLDLLKKFIDSKEKTPGRKKEPDVMEYWPLIKVVKVFVKSEILKTGLVLVDLPGVHDSNAARSAVASKYIEQCFGLWIVAPITRAVDDRVAQKLLGDSFKRQMQLDGTYSSITVICSKADDISVTEALKAVPQEAEANHLHARTELLEAERDQLQEALNTIKKQLSDNHIELDERLTEIRCLKSAIDDSDDEEPEPEEEQISREDAEQRLQDAEARLDELREECKALRLRGPSEHKKLKDLKTALRKLKTDTKHACIKYRNDYSRPAIQRQFAEGIREIDQENAALDEDNFDPNFVHRDYDEIAAKLPVFCVSSKAYQKISGRLANDEHVAGYARREDTEIPALQRHGLGIIHETRAATCRRFLSELGRFLTSLHLQVVQSDQPLKIADDLREKELQSLAKSMDTLNKDLDLAIRGAFISCRDAVDLNIFRKLPEAARIASKAAIPTVNSWICHKNDGGLAYQTFRATCVRDGVFKSPKRGPMDFNQALTEPMTKHLAWSWEYVFQNCLPERLDFLAEALQRVLRSFRLQMSKRSQLKKATTFTLVNRQVKSLEEGLKDTTEFKATIVAGQKEASRLFVPVISEVMAGAYTYCVEESGIGCFKRIKAHVTEHVENVRGTMFTAATQKAKTALIGTLDEVESEVKERIQEVVALINKDYSALLANQTIFRALSTARDEIRNLLGQVDQRFDRVLRQPAEPTRGDQPEQPAVTDADLRAAAVSLYRETLPENSVSGTEKPTAADAGIPRSAATALNAGVRIKLEPTSEDAAGEDVPMKNA